ncbi:MAG: sodium:solute symporter family protein [Gammaproteobacteria bacterium]|nr:sodium:solute symporter family protein [Gammaproteobacteria bacterium]
MSLWVIVAIVALGTAIGFLAGRRREMDLEQWTVGGRRFGAVLMYMLLAGELYTTFAFLGASGWAYSRGGPSLYILAYISLGCVVSFFIMPRIWELGRRHGMQTQPDFFAARYGNRFLNGLVCVVGIAAVIPYLQLQIEGLGIIVNVASFGGIGRAPAMVVSVGLLVAFVWASGIRAVAWISVLKDILMIVAALAIGIAIPHIYFGGIGPMFAALLHARPGHLTMPGATKNLDHTWYVSTVLLSSLGYCMWPHYFASAFSARSADVIRRNAVILPLYSLTLPFIFFAGFAAVLVVPGLADGDLSLLTMIRKTFPSWFLGVAGGAGALTAMVPAAVLVLTAATLFAKNLFRPAFAPTMSDDRVARLARIMVAIIGIASLGFALFSSASLVSLLLIGYAGVAQLFPGVVLGIFWRRATAAGVLSGLVAGIATAASLLLTHHDPILGWNAGFAALCLNFGVTIFVSFRGSAASSEFAGRTDEPVGWQFTKHHT